MTSPYDPFAWFYDRYWASPPERWQRKALQSLLLPSLTPSAKILDLCCGTGNLAAYLTSLHFAVVGVDSSSEMLRIARRNAPQAEFLGADAAYFAAPCLVDAAVCMFDSLNHLLQREQLELAFRSVYAALRPGGLFVFDVNTSEAYGAAWKESACEVQDDHAFFLRGGYDSASLIGRTRITMFRKDKTVWRRADVEIRQRPWEVPEIESLLGYSGFVDAASYRACDDLGLGEHYGTGRVYFRACRNYGALTE